MCKILVLGVSGMLGHTLFEYFKEKHEVYGTLRSKKEKSASDNIFYNVDAEDLYSVESVIKKIQPDYIINCIGVIKQHTELQDLNTLYNINALFPHKLAKTAYDYGAKIIHFSTDCVFDGKRGNYTENSIVSAEDLYGQTKFFGELHYKHTITLRTSIIGHELNSSLSLVDWFLTQKESVTGYNKAVYTGFPAIEIAHILNAYILNKELKGGLYHLSADKITKYDLLKLTGKVYSHNIDIEKDETVCIDRSLDSGIFREKTDYIPPSWESLIQKMYQFEYKQPETENDSV